MAGSALPSREALRQEWGEIIRFLEQNGLMQQFHKLQEPDARSSVIQIAVSYSLCVGAWYSLVRFGPIALLPALVLIANRQRALGNTLHDVAHGNTFQSKREWIAQWLLCAPIFEDLKVYRRLHLLHHAHAGDPRLDPDFVELPQSEKRAWQLYIVMLERPAVWIRNVLGDVNHFDARRMARTLCFWIGATSLASLVVGAEAWTLPAVWFMARATTYHALHVFTELSDHVGLTPGTAISYTRNAPHNLLTPLFHPHYDGYHLTHHLAPRVRMANLPRLHKMLLDMNAYREAEHCDGYFFGRKPVAHGWVSRPDVQATVQRPTAAGALSA